jgi:hypothetical protein
MGKLWVGYCAGALPIQGVDPRAVRFAFMSRVNAPPLVNIRSTFTQDGRFAQLTFVNKAGAHMSFTIAHAQFGPLLTALRRMVGEMGRRLEATGRVDAAQVANALADAQPVSGLAVGKDQETNETLVLFEMGQDGSTSVRLPPDVLEELCGALDCDAYH